MTFPVIDIAAVAHIAQQAGQKIMEFYGEYDIAATIEQKADQSPVTVADKAAHQVIAEGLAGLGHPFPILSEEGRDIPYHERRAWPTFWIVDPLDGTKEFIRRTGHFAVNIGLIHHDFPVAGVIYLPVSGLTYYADANGAFKITPGQLPVRLQCPAVAPAQLRAVRSKGNFGPAEQQVLDALAVQEVRPVGSSIKYCQVAEGQAELYYRASPNSEWDSAAGQAIVEQAGGKILAVPPQPTGFERFGYNKPSLINGPFVCVGFADTLALERQLAAILS
ncbi:MAG: 3'(2'),5'-bisphosphate nucleotidase CysQ [Bernardetiaceae bacterium]|jgi:3'(2'), 5'-bisphosphate nucleotidase|nr:3'(2'),5'-bisphosphate nucleotidase CysQ [Bernardetiaceae bacterium]